MFALLSSLSLPAQSVPPLPILPLDTYTPALHEQIAGAFQNALKNPKDAETNGRLGMLLYAYEQYEFAEPCFERARAFSPKDRRWSYYLGRTQANLSRYEQAITSFQDALREDPDYLPARLKLGECLLEVGKTEDSRKIYEAIAEQHPDDASAQYGLGRIYAARRILPQAIEHLRKACELFPPFGAAHFALAGAYRDNGDSNKAKQEFALYQKDKLRWPTPADPLLAAMLALKTDAMAHLRKGIDLAEAGRWQAAAEEHERALAADPKLVQAHVHLITIYAMLGLPEKAEEHYHAAVVLDSNLVEVYYNYGVLLTGQNRYAEAMDAYRRALALDPSHAEANNNYAYLLMTSGQLDEAAERYRAVIENKPDYRAAHFNLGRILVQQGKIREAIVHFEQTLTPEDDEAPRCIYALGAAYARIGDRVNALKYMRQAREKALTFGQSGLVEVIEKDLRRLEATPSRP